MDRQKSVSSKESRSFFRPLVRYFQETPWSPVWTIALIALLLRLPNLNESLWFDELWSTRLVLKNLTLLSNTLIFDLHPPFYSLFMYVWVKFFGDAELAVRMPPLIFGISSIVLAYALAVKLTEKKTALLMSVLLCLSPVHIWYSQEARPYSATLFLLLLSILSYHKLKDSPPHPVWYFVYVGSMTTAVLSHYYIGVYVILISAMCIFEWIRHLNAEVNRRLLILNSVSLACLIAFVSLKRVFSGIVLGSSYLRALTPFQLWMLFFNWFLCGNSLWDINPYNNDVNVLLQKPLMGVVQMCFFVLFMHGTTLILKEKKQTENSSSAHLLLYLFSLPLFIMGLHLVGLENAYIERSAFVALPFFYMILAKGATAFESKPVTISCIVLTIIFSIISLTAYFWKSERWTVYKPNPDWRAAAGYFGDELKGTAERSLAFGATPATELTYYDVRIRELLDATGADYRLKMLEGRVKRLLGGKNLLAKTISAGIEREVQFRNQERAHARLLIHYPNIDDTEAVYRALSRQNVKTFYLIHNRYWPGRFKKLLKIVMEDARVQFQSNRSLKGIEIFKFRVVS